MREKRVWERKREKVRRNPKIVLGIVFLARNQQETRELKRQSEVLKREIRL
jgi:hypothetical protein